MKSSRDDRSVRASLKRYQVMAVITGIFLILVFLGVALEYPLWPGTEALAAGSPALLEFINMIQFIHGFIYIVYLWVAIDLWTRMRWSLGRLAVLVLGGVIPVLTFVAERRVARDVAASLES